jgi:hypothetical protein
MAACLAPRHFQASQWGIRRSDLRLFKIRCLCVYIRNNAVRRAEVNTNDVTGSSHEISRITNEEVLGMRG